MGGLREPFAVSSSGHEHSPLGLSSSREYRSAFQHPHLSIPFRFRGSWEDNFSIFTIVKSREVDEKNSVKGRINRILRHLSVESVAHKSEARVLRSLM